MQSPATISVIVPVYNAEKTIRKCVESICNSDYPHLEIICINDGSTDSSQAILNELASRDPRIVVISQENGGLSAARNTGLNAATGMYVAGVDADDYIDNDLYGAAVAKFTEETDLVSFGFTEEYEPPEARPLKRLYKDRPFKGYRDSTEHVILNMHPMFCMLMWRRSVIEQHHIRFNPKALHEDVDFLMKTVVHCRKIYFLSHRGYHYLQHADSIMGRQLSGNISLEPMLNDERFLCTYYRENGLWEKWKQLFIHSLVRHSASSKHFFPPAEHAAVQRAYYNLALELGLPGELPADFPLKTLKPVKGWKKLFLSNLPNVRVYRFFGIPWGCRQYVRGKVKWRWCLPSPLAKLAGRTRRSGK